MEDRLDEIPPDAKRAIVDADYLTTKDFVEVVEDELEAGGRGGDAVDTGCERVRGGRCGHERR